MIALSYLSLLGLLVIGGWILWIRGRGSLNYWIRPLRRREAWALGVELGSDDAPENDPHRLAEVVAMARTLDRESARVIRHWNREKGTRFIGLVLSKPPDEPVDEPYRIRHYPSVPVLRISGRSNVDGGTPSEAAKAYVKDHGGVIDLSHPYHLSGQSFALYEWEFTAAPEEDHPIDPLSERVFQLRDIVLFPMFLTLFSIALIGTQNKGLFGVGLLLLIFLSGACKFVFFHQREDESQESHLQNY